MPPDTGAIAFDSQLATLLTLTLLHSPYMESDENIAKRVTQSQKVMDMEQFPLCCLNPREALCY